MIWLALLGACDESTTLVLEPNPATRIEYYRFQIVRL